MAAKKTSAPAAATTTPDVHEAPVDGATPATDTQTAPGPEMTPEAIAEAVRIMQEDAVRRAAAEADLARAEAEEAARREKAAAELAKARTAEATRRALADLMTAVTATYSAVADGNEEAMATGLERIYAETANVRRASRIAPARTSTRGTVRVDRAAPRPLRPEITAHLRAHPDTEFTPGQVAKVLDRSSGAVANALSTMCEAGEVELTNERPMRYRLAVGNTEAANAAESA